MKKQIIMPKLKEDMEKGALCAWCAEEGDRIQAGDVLFEVEASKVVEQVEAEESGVIEKLYFEEGDDVPVGAVIAEIETEK